eukprot:SAG31_NODE_99_length_25388_cov_12.710507_2_plen_351_part_00
MCFESVSAPSFVVLCFRLPPYSFVLTVSTTDEGEELELSDELSNLRVRLDALANGLQFFAPTSHSKQPTWTAASKTSTDQARDMASHHSGNMDFLATRAHESGFAEHVYENKQVRNAAQDSGGGRNVVWPGASGRNHIGTDLGRSHLRQTHQRDQRRSALATGSIDTHAVREISSLDRGKIATASIETDSDAGNDTDVKRAGMRAAVDSGAVSSAHTTPRRHSHRYDSNEQQQQLKGSRLSSERALPKLELLTETDVEATILKLCDCDFDMSNKEQYRTEFKRQASQDLKKFYAQLRHSCSSGEHLARCVVCGKSVQSGAAVEAHVQTCREAIIKFTYRKRQKLRSTAAA